MIVTNAAGVAPVNPNDVIAECTVPEKILLAASELEGRGETPFSAEALIVCSWKGHPKTFGLKGFADFHPDSNKVLASIMGEKGLAKKGWLQKVGQKLYVLTEDGKEVVQRLRQGETVTLSRAAKSVKAPGFPPELEIFVQSIFDSAAFTKFQEQRRAEIIFVEACKFWGISESMTTDAIDNRRLTFADTLKQLKVEVKPSTMLSNGRSLDPEDLDFIIRVHEFLQDRFSRNLAMLRHKSQG
jgi:hypothetical protein